MSNLKALVDYYTGHLDVSVPVEYYTAAGTLVRGAIQRLDGDAAIVAFNTHDTTRVKINVRGFAGAANPEEWCLSRTAFAKYGELESVALPDITTLEKAEKRRKMREVFDNLKDIGDDVTYHTVTQWPGLSNEDLIGFVSFNIHELGKPLSGFLYLINGTARFVQELPQNVKLSPM